MRVAAMFLPELALELADVPASWARAVVITEETHQLAGHRRLDAVCARGRAAGVFPGQTVAAARARLAELKIRSVAPAAITAGLTRLCEVALGFGTPTSYAETPPTVWVDVTGGAHLYGGETALLERLRDAARTLGHESRVALADGPSVAAAVARFGEALTVVPEGGSREALTELPVEALPIANDVHAWLRHLGLTRIADVQRQPRRELARRLGADAPRVLSLLDGDDRAVLVAYTPPWRLEESCELEDGVENGQALLFIAKRLCDRLAARLLGRGLLIARLHFICTYGRRRDAIPPETHELRLGRPLADAETLLALLRVRIDALEIPKPVTAVRLSAVELVPRTGKPLDLFSRESKAERALPGLVATLEAELGRDRVGVLHLDDRWPIAVRASLVPLDVGHEGARLASVHALDTKEGAPLSGAPEPTRLVEPQQLPGGTSLEPYLRLEAVEWWRNGGARRDYGTAWVNGTLAWVERDAHGALFIRGYWD